MNDESNVRVFSGGCLCGAVRYEAKGPLRPAVGCHCSQCRRTSGHYVVATAVTREDLALSNADGLEWYRSSEDAERGFCQSCGSSLFWRNRAGKTISIMAGTLDGETGLTTVAHICVADKGDYYELDEATPQYPDVEHPSPWD